MTFSSDEGSPEDDGNISEDDIDKKLPTKIKKDLVKLINIYNETKNIFTFINLHMYLKNILQPTFTLKEALKGEKIFNGKTIKLSDNNFTYMYIEVIYENFRISNFIYFIKIIKSDSLLWDVDLSEVLYKNNKEYKMSYYKFLKYFFHFLKHFYYKKIFDRSVANKVIDTYNEIYDFRERIGDMNNNLCKIENLNNKKLNKEYYELKEQFELKCKHFFIDKSKLFFQYLKSYFRFI
jgi:hypothetical protein